MKKKNAFLRLSVSALLLMFSVSCGDAQKPEVPVTEPPAKTETASVETEEIQEIPIECIGSLSELDFGGYTLNINISVNSQEWSTSSVYVMGEEKECGDVAKDAVYRRNHELEDALDLHINWIPSDWNYDVVRGRILKAVQSGDGGVDLYINDLSGQISNVLKGCYYNVYDLMSEDTYFDFADEGWLNDYMDQISFVRTRRYFLAGDYFTDLIRSAHAVFFSRNMLASYFDSQDELYGIVDSGKWTFDVFMDYVKDMYRDLNGNGERDADDLYGMMFDPNWTPLYFTTTDCRTVSWDKDGNPFIDPTIERSVRLTDFLIDLKNSTGTYPTDSHLTARTAFTEGKSLFIHWSKLADMEADELRNMDGIGVLPYPKLDEAQEKYLTMSHNTVELGSVPVTISEESVVPLSAYLQAATVYSRKYIIPTYYEIALKIKYSQDEDSARMLDYIRGGLSTPFEYSFRDYTANIGFIAVQNSVVSGTDTVASQIEKNLKKAEKQVKKALDTILDLD